MSGPTLAILARYSRGMRVCVWAGSIIILLAVLQLLIAPQASPLLRADQQAAALMRQGKPAEAAARFVAPEWRAAAHYAAGDFKLAEGILTGKDGPTDCYNLGNALSMQGRYADAIPAFESALAARPEWEDATVNLAIVRQLATRTERTGGEELSELGADEIKFDKKDPNKGTEAKDEAPGAPLDEASLRAMWLRHVQTSPATFLRSKFAYQAAMEEVPREP